MIGLVLAGLGVSHKVVHGASYEDNVGVSSAVSTCLYRFEAVRAAKTHFTKSTMS